MLTIALPKGALLKDSITFFAQAGLDFRELLDPSHRQLQVLAAQGTARALLVRAQDVPVYVQYGQAQLGVVGFDVLEEKQPQVAHLADLGFGHCRLSVAVKSTSSYGSARELPAHCRVASKFVHCAQRYFQDLDLPVDIVPLYGSVELGPLTGMSEAIVDLVSTGRTLRENGLVELEQIFTSTARLIAHPLSYRLNSDNLCHYIKRLRIDGIRIESEAPA
ncbi:ATP phosphoribosyltransferase [Candidatus Synechococcus calcipolaris G9]|uniref:ATP phosphoribosyltransferase n=1 Tax=Candidatus Synechococcus calcipolaris G9 TaxID=1497997 RepID=A0ABT6EUW5_9SYNE|nr:ATP phosphoribosyltransferase [Candidatus Synechococcus calcipolaris]MDG2989344.1 ATP phosphoribosyltransferase [Candidatus Synechococcus calcipolaris G9]